jgi:Tfp pilus assembly protein PilE
MLVVVLIIGILAAIAWPQYQKVVERSRVNNALPVLRSVYEAQRMYYLMHSKYPETFEQLDINIPWNESWRYSLSGAYIKMHPDITDVRYGDNFAIAINKTGRVVLFRRDAKYNAGWGITWSHGHPGQPVCITRSDLSGANDYCQKFFNLKNKEGFDQGYTAAYF